MTSTTTSPSSDVDKATRDLQSKLTRLLAKAKPNKREQVLISFRCLYPTLEEHIALGKPLKEVLAAFNALTQSNVCLRKFNEMLSSERKRRDKDGSPACCHACGQVLKSLDLDHSTLQAQTPSESETAEPENAQ